MANKDQDNGVIDPSMGYSINGAARMLGVTSTWLKHNLIYTGEIPVAQRGHLQLIYGRAIIDWIETNQNMKGAQCANVDLQNADKSKSK